jgi:DNA-binding NarL/FixJ family response regulator
MKCRVLIVEPSEIIVEGLLSILNRQTKFKVLSPVGDVDNFTERIIAARPDVVIINPSLVGRNPVNFGDNVAVVALVYQYFQQSRLNKYDAVIDIRDSRTAIGETLAMVYGRYNKKAVESQDENCELTKREIAVLVQVAKGMTSKEIADKLNVSTNTVITHRKNISRKTGIKSVAGLTVYAMLNNLITDSSIKP